MYVKYYGAHPLHQHFACTHVADGACSCGGHPTHAATGCKQVVHGGQTLHLSGSGTCSGGPIVKTNVQASVALADETVASFDVTKQLAFKQAVASTLSVSASDVTLTISSASRRRLLEAAESSSTGIVVDVVVAVQEMDAMVAGSLADAVANSVDYQPAQARRVEDAMAAPGFAGQLAETLAATAAFSGESIDSAGKLAVEAVGAVEDASYTTTDSEYLASLDNKIIFLQSVSSGSFLGADQNPNVDPAEVNGEVTGLKGQQDPNWKSEWTVHVHGDKIALKNVKNSKKFLRCQDWAAECDSSGFEQGAGLFTLARVSGGNTITLKTRKGKYLASGAPDHNAYQRISTMQATGQDDSAKFRLWLRDDRNTANGACNSGKYRDAAGTCQQYGGTCTNGVTQDHNWLKAVQDACKWCNIGYRLAHHKCVAATSAEGLVAGLDGQVVYLQSSYNGRFLTTDLSSNCVTGSTCLTVKADFHKTNSWQRYTVEHKSGTRIRLRVGADRYVGGNGGTHRLHAETTDTDGTLDNRELFELSFVGNAGGVPVIQLKQVDTQNGGGGYVVAGMDGSAGYADTATTAAKWRLWGEGEACEAGQYHDSAGTCQDFGGTCVNGVLADSMTRTADDQCKSCTVGYYLNDGDRKCVAATTNAEFAKGLDGKSIYLATANGRYIHAYSHDSVAAAGTGAGHWSRLTLIYLGGDKVGFESQRFPNKYLSVNEANSTGLGVVLNDWEKFTLARVQNGGNKITLKSDHNTFLTVQNDDSDGEIKGLADLPDDASFIASKQFTVHLHDDGTACPAGEFKATAASACEKYTCDCPNGTCRLQNMRTGTAQCADCKLGYFVDPAMQCAKVTTAAQLAEYLDGKRISLQSVGNDKYLREDKNGNAASNPNHRRIYVNGAAQSSWERFTVEWKSGATISLFSSGANAYITQNPFKASATQVRSWEEFTIALTGADNVITLQTTSDSPGSAKYLAASDDGNLVYNSDAAADASKFTVELHPYVQSCEGKKFTGGLREGQDVCTSQECCSVTSDTDSCPNNYVSVSNFGCHSASSYWPDGCDITKCPVSQ
jgi:hypothetical protein